MVLANEQGRDLHVESPSQMAMTSGKMNQGSSNRQPENILW